MTTMERYLRKHFLYAPPAPSPGAANDNARLRLTTNDARPPLYHVKCCKRCTEEAAVARFVVGKTYMMRSPGDHNRVWTYSERKQLRRCIKVYGGAEHCMPLGTYSLASCLSAEKEVKP